MNSPLPRVLVLMAACNGGKFIKEQVLSIINQENVTVNILIGLDVSTDDTQKILTDFCLSYPSKIKVVFRDSSPKGPAANFLDLILRAKDLQKSYDYFALSDQDDIWNKYHISKSIYWLNNGFEGVSSDLIAFAESPSGTRKKLVRKSSPQTVSDYIFESGSAGCTFVFSKLVVGNLVNRLEQRSEYIEQIRHHDWIIYAISRDRNLPWKIRRFPTVFYRQHSNNYIGANSGIAAYIKRLKYFLNGRYNEDICCTISLLSESRQNALQDIRGWARAVKTGRRNHAEACILRVLSFFRIVQFRRSRF